MLPFFLVSVSNNNRFFFVGFFFFSCSFVLRFSFRFNKDKDEDEDKDNDFVSSLIVLVSFLVVSFLSVHEWCVTVGVT